MDNEPSITDLLRQLSAPSNAHQDIYDYFLESARKEARQRLSTKLQGRVTASTIAHEALSNCLQQANKPNTSFLNRRDFRRLLSKHIRYRLADAAEHVTAQKRDINQETSEVIGTADEGTQPTADQLVVADELALKLVQCIFQEPNEVRRTACLLGILLENKASTIAKMIEPLIAEQLVTQGLDPESRSPLKGIPRSTRSIQLLIKNCEARLQRELGIETDE